MFEMIMVGLVAILLVEVVIAMDSASCRITSYVKDGENKRMTVGQTIIFLNDTG